MLSTFYSLYLETLFFFIISSKFSKMDVQNFKKMKSDKNKEFSTFVYFLLIFFLQMKRENSNGKIMSTKICQKFLYFELTLVFLECYAQIGGKRKHKMCE